MTLIKLANSKMEWQQILGFYHAARLKSFTRAAEATLRTQSALSQQIKALEEEFGSDLFERIGKKKLKLTLAGEKFYRFVESVLESYGNLKEALDEINSLGEGHLRVAAPFTTLYHLFPERIKDYLNRFPHVELTLLDRPQEGVVRLVREGEADFGLVLESVLPKGLASIRWKRVETVLMVPLGHALTQIKRVNWEQIAEYPLILPPKDLNHVNRNVFVGQFQKLGLTYRTAMESSNVELSSLYVETGLGISPATIVKGLPSLRGRKLEFLALGHYFPPDHIALIMRKGKVLTSYKKAFVDTILSEGVTTE